MGSLRKGEGERVTGKGKERKEDEQEKERLTLVDGKAGWRGRHICHNSVSAVFKLSSFSKPQAHMPVFLTIQLLLLCSRHHNCIYDQDFLKKEALLSLIHRNK